MKAILKNRTPLYLLLIIILASVLRLYGIGYYSFWLDEALTVIDSTSLKEFITEAFKGNYPLIFYNFIIYFWLKLGTNEAILRLSSALFGIFSIIFIYLISKLIANKMVGIFTSILLAISPFHIYYSQELRMYSLICFLTLISTYFLLKILRFNKFSFWLVYIFSNIVNIYTHPLSFIFFITHILFIGIFFKDRAMLIKKFTLAALIILIFLIPCFFLTISSLNLILKGDINYIFGVDWIPKVKVLTLFETVKIFSSGYHTSSFSGLTITFIFLLLFFLGLFFTKKDKEFSILPFSFFIPIFFLLFISLLLKPFYVTRYIIASSCFYYIIVSYGLFKIKKVGFGILFLILTLTYFPLKNYYTGFEPKINYRNTGVNVKFDDYRGGALYLANNLEKDDIILHMHRNTIFPFKYYLDYRYKRVILNKLANDKILNASLVLSKNKILEFYNITYRHNKILKTIDVTPQRKDNRIWLIYYPTPNSFEILDLMKKEYYLVLERKLNGFSIYLFNKNRNQSVL